MSENNFFINEVELLFKKNAFELFNLNLEYNIDKNLLKKNYLLLQKKYHPDKYVTQSELINGLMSNLSVYINEQYQILLNPVHRSILIFKIFNYEFDINDNSKLTLEFLMQQMDLQEEIEEIKADQNKLFIVEQDLVNKINFMEKEINNHFSSQNFDKASKNTIELLFYMKIYDRIVHNNLF
jgi:molecular chaperone HscB